MHTAIHTQMQQYSLQPGLWQITSFPAQQWEATAHSAVLPTGAIRKTVHSIASKCYKTGTTSAALGTGGDHTLLPTLYHASAKGAAASPSNANR